MGRWKDEKSGLESKAQLKAHRIHKFDGIFIDEDLDMKFYPVFTQAEKDLQFSIWQEADVDYETRKGELREKLNALSPTELTTYFNEIGVEQIPIEDYLPESPV